MYAWPLSAIVLSAFICAFSYYLVVPAGTYSSGFTVTVKDENGDIMTKGTNKSLPLEAGHLYPMKAFDFVPTGQETTISISSAADLVKFAQDYNKGDYDAPKVPVVLLTTNISGFTTDQKNDFNETGGIGSSTKKFHGTFDGAGFSIADLKVSAPLFSHIGPTGIVQNVELTSTCSVTYSADISADTNLGAIAGYSEGIINNCVNRGAVTCSSTTRTAGVLKIGGILGRQNASGTISNCINYGAVTSTTPGSPGIYMGGVVGAVERPASGDMALLENCVNHGDVKNGVDSGEPLQPCILHMGGVVGWIYSSSSSPDMTITGLVNTGNVTKTANSAKSNNIAVLVGGIVGGIHSTAISDRSGNVDIKNSHVKDCRIQNGDFNNKVGYGEASHVGGFVAVARGNQTTKNISFSDNCYVKDVYVSCTRGFAGGFVSWARGAVFTDCQVLKSSVRGNILAGGQRYCFYAGGIAGCAYDCDLTDCVAELTKEDTQGDDYDTYTLYTNYTPCVTGGIVAQARGTTTIDGCEAFVKKMYQGTADLQSNRGWIVGYADDNNGTESPSITIKDCAVGGACTSAPAVTLTSDNFGEYLYGSKGSKATVTVTGTNSYWDGTNAPSAKKTVTISIVDYAAANGWINTTQEEERFYREVSHEGVTLTASDNGDVNHNGVYNTQWRFYQARGGGLTISVPIGYSLVAATFTYANKNNGVIIAPDGETQVPTGESCDLSGSSAMFTFGPTNGRVFISQIVIEYE